jgi:enterochelin esterase-like enzyme
VRRIIVVVVVLALVGIGAWLGYGLLTTDTEGAEVRRVTVDSRLTDGKRRLVLVRPDGAGEGRPLLVLLHGNGNDPDDMLSEEFYDGLAALGDRAPVVAVVDGGDGSYYHDRRDGKWGAWVTREAIPRARRELGADPRRTAIGGISMGGYGALDIARLHPGTFCAVGSHSGALWRTGGETPAEAFDDAEDFARHDVIAAVRANPNLFGDARVWIDYGTEDPFVAGGQALRDALRAGSARVTVRTGPGGHKGAYWNRNWGRYLRFYARALAAC